MIIEHVKKLINLCVRPFSDTLNIKDLSQGKWATIKEVYIKPQKSDANKIILPQVLSNQVNENVLTIGKIIINFLQVNKHNIISPFSLIQPYLPKKY
ncbi:hypothetical protein REISMN_04605 [Rickettsia tamurae subsp. buchneri]|uniref:Uncharacterized protein n=1 Tax=Rickettsia tamurae subsp. buchneri TaxID=1462938 RepID=A0A8E0WLM0_9RICK|nr:hypothetical protein REIS_0410 [Rickettsia endosymbiont of Ixodes scapularis]KDO02905.1 hypothetical protein REISMN_04605 [Rickettsia tamurae subsp. buchneri]